MADMTSRPIVALDASDAPRATALVRLLGKQCDFVKVGSELFTSAGPGVVGALREIGCEVFLDLKLHDIPNTVRGAARAAARLGVRLITVHASGGRAMIDAAVEGAGSDCGVLAVTVLTSLDVVGLGDVWGRPVAEVRDEVLRLSDIARSAGARGVVCSGHEAAAVHARHGPSLELLVPGVRMPEGPVHDQKRVVTPAEAAKAGATYVVIGRAVTEADDPRRALEQVNADLGRV